MTPARRARALWLALLAAPALAHASLPLGYHQRTASGWVLVAVQASLPDYTACLLNPPLPASGSVTAAGADPEPAALPDRRPSPAGASPEVLGRDIAGHLVIRADGPSPEETVRAVMRTRTLPSEAAGERLDEVDRHLLVLCGARWPRLVGVDDAAWSGPPVLLVAGPDEPAPLMQRLLALVDELPPVGERGAGPGSGPADALPGWWRHLERADSAGAIALGFVLTEADPGADAARRIAFRALAMRLNQAVGGVVWREQPAGSGRVRWARVAAAPDSTAAVREALQAALGELRQELLPPAELAEHREHLRRLDERSITSPDRWFAETLLRVESGEPPASAFDAAAVWDSVDADAVRRACLSAIPRQVIAVSSGMLSDRAGPTEIWPARDLLVDDLPPSERTELARNALERMCARLGGGSAVEAMEVESDWSMIRSGAPLSGRLVETLRYPDAIRWDFRPAGSEVAVCSWVADGSGFASVAGEPRDLAVEDRRRLENRLRADPWSVCALAGDAASTGYAGGTRDQGEVYQRVRVEDGAGGIVVDLDPESALPHRVTLERGALPGVLIVYLHHDFRSFAGLLYPGRIECRVGPRRESLSIVRAVAPRSRLAATGRLQ